MARTSYKYRYVDPHPHLREYRERGKRFDEFLEITGLQEYVGEWPEKHSQLADNIPVLDHVTLFYKGAIPIIMSEPYHHYYSVTKAAYFRVPQILAPYHGIDLTRRNHTGSFLYAKLINTKHIRELEDLLLKAAAEKPQIEFDDYLEGAS